MTTEAQVDLIGNAARGASSLALAAAGGSVHALRPYIGDDGRSYVNRPTGKFAANGEQEVQPVLIGNSGATLRKNEWQYLDSAVVKAAKARLSLINTLRSAGMTVNFPQAFNHSVYQYQRMTDISEANVSMSAKSQSQNDRVTYDLVSIPLPLVHKEFEFDSRELAISRNLGAGQDVQTISLAAERVAEKLEQIALGLTSFTYAGATMYGLTNFPSRNTGAFLNPSVSGWTPEMLYNSVIQMMKVANDDFHYGPYHLFYSTGLMAPLMRNFSTNYQGGSLINNIRSLPGISGVSQLDYLTGNQLILVQLSPMTAQILVGMDVTLVQWSENGGLTDKFRVMGMMVPLMKTDVNSNTGIVHFTGNNTTA